MEKCVQELCRLCGEQRLESFSVFIKCEEGITVNDIIREAISITIPEDDTMPTDICSRCNLYLLEFWKFKRMAEKTQLLLIDLAANLKKEKPVEQVLTSQSPTKFEEHAALFSNHDISSDEDNIPLKEILKDSLTNKNSSKKKQNPAINLQLPAKRTRQLLKRTLDKESSGDFVNNAAECNICRKRFTKERYLRLHLRLTHKILVESSYPCDRCTRKFMQKESYERHMKLHNDPEFNKPVPCDICGKVYSTRQTLRAHIRTVHMDDGERKFVCEECGAVFKAISSLKAHKISHTGEFPYECSKCDRRFQTKTNLIIHMDIHSDTPYICSICSSQSTTLRGLRLHMIKHSDVKPHQCPMCGNAYKRVTALKKHLIVHSGIKPYSCNFCERTFADGSNRRIHMKRVHKAELAEMEASGMKFTPTTLPKLQQLKKDGLLVRA